MPQRTREHIIADLSVNFVERQALLAGHTVERWVRDYGIDLVISTYDADGEPEAGSIFVQLKATDRLKTVNGGRFIPLRIERAHLRRWLLEPMPVILIVYNAPSNRAYWLHVQTEFVGAAKFRASVGSATLTIQIPISQKVNQAAIRQFRQLEQAVVDRFNEARSIE
jgi:hypothetical protein